MVRDNLADDCFGALNRGSAQGLVEYSLIIALVAVLALAGLVAFGGGLGGDLTTMFASLAGSV